MSDQPRAFRGRPNLRFLKIEAKRRLAAGEFGTLHDAQLAIAREHGLPSWTALKESVSAPGHALTQVRWVGSPAPPSRAGPPRTRTSWWPTSTSTSSA
jgi:hypothetical protein